MKTGTLLLAGLMVTSFAGLAAEPTRPQVLQGPAQARPLTEADRKLEAGRILIKWGDYVEKVNGQDRKAWAAALWPSLASADLDNLLKASRAVTYEGMRNALLGQRLQDEQIIDRMAKSSLRPGGALTKALGNLASDLVFTPITPCRIVDTRNIGGRITAGTTRELDAANAGGSFSLQGGDAGDCGIPANPAALALSVTGLGNTTTGYLRIFPYGGTSAQGSPVPLNSINTTATNDIIVPASQGTSQELKVFSTANTHYAVFVTGYFMAPAATALECQGTSLVQKSLPAGYVGYSDNAACPAGYSAVSAYCYGNTAGVSSQGSGIVSNYAGAPTWCAWQNSTASTQYVFTGSMCCRVPGR